MERLGQAVANMREGAWLSPARARAYLAILATVTTLAAIAYLATANGHLDVNGKPIGTDFASFWAASHLALTGNASEAWSPLTHGAVQSEMFGAEAGYAAFFYPPPYLLVCLPLAFAPYLVSLAIWLIATGAGWLRMTRAWLNEAGAPRIGWLALLAFPAVFINAGHGQNGFLTAALFGAGALLCERRPWLAGVFFGALVIKPQLALVIPFFLIITGNWRSFIAAGVTAMSLCALSFAAFGIDAWRGFFEGSAMARAALEQNLVGFEKMQSAYAGVRLLGGSTELAWIAQGITALAALTALWSVRHAGALAGGAALVCATLLTTPFLLDYDFTLLAIPLAWLFARAQTNGFLGWERLVLLAAFMLPLIARPLAGELGLPIAPLVIAALLLCIARRARREADAEETRPASLAPLSSAVAA